MKFTQQELDVLFSALCLMEMYVGEKGLERDSLYEITGRTKHSFLKFVHELKQKFIANEKRQ